MSWTTGSRLAALAAGVAAAAFLAGCGNGVEVGGPPVANGPQASPARPASPTAPTTRSADPTVTPTGSATSDRSDKPSAPDSSSKPSGAGTDGSGTKDATCTLADLDISVQTPAGGGAAGSQYVLLAFRNKSSDTCAIFGYPGVSFVGHHDGTQLGKPAVRNRARAHTVRLAPGATESSVLRIAQADNFDPKECQPTTADGFRVYPPGSYTAAYVPFTTSACQGNVAQLTVYPVGTKS